MKKFLMISGVIFWVLIITAVAYFGFIAWIDSGFSASSQAFVDKNIPIIISTWSEQEALRFSSSGLKAEASNPEKQILFARAWKNYESLGALKKYNGSKGQAYAYSSFFMGNTGKEPKNGFYVTAKYVAEADFQNGSAQITVYLIRENGEWKINDFSVDSK
jgi:hypothetical protein